MYKAYPESQAPVSTTSRSKDKVASFDPSWNNWGSFPPNSSTEDAQSVDWSGWCLESGSQGAPIGERAESAVAQCSPLPGSSLQTQRNPVPGLVLITSKTTIQEAALPEQQQASSS
eukprot:11825646-Prorocentrum_lima.AAC.1